MIPGVDDLAGGRLTHHMRDLYSNQTTQNELGYSQGAKSVAGIAAIGIPPWAVAGFLLTCDIFLRGRTLLSCPDGDKVTYQWFPHHIIRETFFLPAVFRHMNHWCCTAGGAFTDLVIDSIFGVELTLGSGVRIHSRVTDFDPNARLRNLRCQAKNYNVSAKGAARAT